MAEPSAFEQYLLELINADRALAGAQPLAFDGDLNEAAEGHSAWMIGTDTFSHTGAGGSDAGQRMQSAGYVFSGSWSWGENIAWASTRSPAGFKDEVELLHSNLMNSPGHRANLLSNTFREIGLGYEIGEYQGWEGAFVTENFAKSGSSLFLTGVAFDDQDGDRFYDPGEGLGNITVTAVSSGGTRYSTTTMAAGGYDLALPAGSYTVTFSGASIATTTRQATIGGTNVKVDLVDPAGGGTPPPPPPPPPPSGTINGTSGNDALNGTAAAELLRGLDGDDVLIGGGGADTLEGGNGSDWLRGDAGGDSLVGGAGSDFANYSWSSVGVTVSLLTGAASGGEAAGDSLSGIENVWGSNGSDLLTGDGGANWIAGNDGNDTIVGGAGADRLEGRVGSDVVSYATSSAGVNVSLAAGTASGGDASGDVISGFEHVWGSNSADTLTGDGGANWIVGNDGNDALVGGAGADTLEGGNGSDWLRGDAGADSIVGGAGNDYVNYSWSSVGVTVSLQTGVASGGEAAGDRLSGIENIWGSDGSDFLFGDGSANWIVGNGGNDTLIGGLGNDTLDGRAGADVISYQATALSGGDLQAGGRDISNSAVGDRVDLTSQVEALLRINGTTLSAAGGNVAVGSSFAAGRTDVAFSGGALWFDLNRNGVMESGADFSIALGGATSVTYDTINDYFLIA